jgi:tetratricopeptide (TPR) repeat protein
LERITLLERGLVKHPDDAPLEAALGDWLMRVGRQNDAAEHARRASELDPLSPAARMRYVWTLAHSGKPEALDQLKEAERLWPGATNIELARFSYEMRYGDPKAAMTMMHEGTSRWGQEALIAFLEARRQPTPANIDRAVDAERELNRQVPEYISGLVTTLATFGRNAEAVQALLDYRHPEAAGFNSEGWFRAPMRGMRRDPRFIRAMAQVGLVTYWKRSGKWPDFCFEPDLPYDCRKEAARVS